MLDVVPRKGLQWEDVDYRRVVDGIRSGLSDEEIARQVGRSVGALRSRARYLLCSEVVSSSKGLTWGALRAVLSEDLDYDWESAVRASHKREKLLSDPIADARMAKAWEAGTPSIPELAREFEVSELTIAQRFIRRGLATDRFEVADRLGYEDGGALEMQMRVDRDRASVIVPVLVATSAAGLVEHVSLHPTFEAAESARDALNVDESGAPQTWTIAGCVVGEGAARDGEIQVLTPATGGATPDEQREKSESARRQIVKVKKRWATLAGRLRSL